MYLATYNPLSAAGWSLILYHALSRLFSTPQPNSLLAKASAALPFVQVPSLLPVPLAPLYTLACTTYDAVGQPTTHVLHGLVHSSLPTTFMQVSSWLFFIWCIAVHFPSVCAPVLKNSTMLTDTDACFPCTKAQRSLFYVSMVISWVLTEVIHYAFYATTLIGDGHAPVPLTWVYHSTFFVLCFFFDSISVRLGAYYPM